MKETIVTKEPYRGYEIQVREEWHLTRREFTGYGICHTGGGINFETPSMDVSLLAPAAEVYVAVPYCIENAQDAIDVVYEGEPGAVFDEMDAGRITRVWSDRRVEVGGEKTWRD